MQAAKTLLAKITTLQYRYLFSNCEEKLDTEMKNNVIGLCRRRKIWIAASKFDKFCKGNSINAGYCLVLFSWTA